jgi:hypothetical protein
MNEFSHFVFIVGCPHSGTTIIHRLYSIHPEVFGIPGESGLFLNNPTQDKIKKTFELWQRQAVETGKQFVVEKTPWHGLKMQQILEIDPSIRFLFIVRNPIDTYGSLKQRGATARIPDSFEGRIKVIKRFFDAAIETQVPLVMLEDFIQSPSTVLAQSMNAVHLPCGAHDAEEILSMHASAKAITPETSSEDRFDRQDGPGHRELRAWQVSQPIFKDTRNRTNLNDQEINQVMTELSPLVANLSRRVDLTSWSNDFE